MFKKVAVYGLAFGSLSASMVLIQFLNGLYRERTFVSAIPVIANILFPAIGVFMFVKSISLMKTEKPINMGKGLFGALMVSVVVALCNIAAYQHVMFNRTDVIADFRLRNYESIESFYQNDQKLDSAAKSTAIITAKENFEENISTGSWGRTQFLMCLSTGLVVALITFLWNTRKPAS